MAIHGTNCTHVGNISNEDCNKTMPEVDNKGAYDSIGAMHFIVAVIVVYGVAVIGVFILGQFRRRGKLASRVLDKQANHFLKQMPIIRESLEKQQRLCSIHHLLPNDPSYADDKKQMTVLGDGILKYMSIADKPTNGRTPHSMDTEVELECIGTVNERSSSVNSWLDVIKEVDDVTSDDLEDDVFMNSRERTSLGVDIYIKM